MYGTDHSTSQMVSTPARQAWRRWWPALAVLCLAAVASFGVRWRLNNGSFPASGSGGLPTTQALTMNIGDGPAQPSEGAVPGRSTLAAAVADPFVLPQASVPVPPPPVYVEPVVLAAPVEQLPPMPSLKFTGVMHGADGEMVVAAQWDDGAPVFLKVGDVLDNGFRVESVSKQSVQVKHPENLQVLVLPLPASPKFEIR